MLSLKHSWRSVVALIALAPLAIVFTGPVDADRVDFAQWSKQRVNGSVAAPSTPNPLVANLPFNNADVRSWDTYAVHASAERRAVQDKGKGPKRGPRSDAVNERPGNNDSPNKAQPVFLDTDNSQGAAGIDITGTGPDVPEGTTTDAGPVVELVGSIPDAAVLPVLAPGDSVAGSGVIGDEVDDPFDFDFLALPDLQGGTAITVDIDTADPFGDLDPFVVFWDADGNVLDFNDDGSAESFDSFLVADIPADGTYYVSVGGFGAFAPIDPFDSASESDTGLVGSEGEYTYAIEAIEFDTDFYKFRLAEGDVFGAAAFDGGSTLELRGPDGELLIGSSQDFTFIHPEASPLPGGGNAALSYVIEEAGKYTLSVRSTGDYLAELRAFRPTGDVPGRGTQVIFLDFDGGLVDVSAFGAPPDFPPVDLSPLSAFLPNWGLDASDEDAVIDAIIASVEESLQADIEERSGNAKFDIEILNSRDHGDVSGPLVSRIVVGGTIEESGIPTVGIAQSIDVGNFETEEVALVLLDLLSAPEGSELFIPSLSLNSYLLADGTDIIDIIGTGVGNITAHEAGHFLANWHTDQFNDSPNIMDQGGNFPNTIGVGEDLVFGSEDDVDVDFGEDVYVPNEGFRGVEDTLTSIGYGLWSSED